MSQVKSNYARQDRDKYSTPAWVTRAFLPFLRRPIGGIWEPACGDGNMVDVLLDAGFCVSATDISTGHDFLRIHSPPAPTGAVITNPPFLLAEEFCDHALRLMEPFGGQVAMLLRVDFDSAKTRAHLFRDCPAWSKKIVLTKRIVWFEPQTGAKGKSPSENHAVYIWDWKHDGPPTISYAP